MGRVVAVNELSEYQRDDVIVVRQDIVEEYRLFVAGGDIPRPVACYRLSPNAEASDVTILLRYVRDKFHPDLAVDYGGIDQQHVGFFHLWDSFVTALASAPLGRSGAMDILAEVHRLLPALLMDCGTVLTILGKYVTQVIEPLLDSGPFGVLSDIGGYPKWYKSPVAHRPLLEAFVGSFPLELSGTAHPVAVLLERAQIISKTYGRIDGPDIGRRLYLTSAYFGWLAKHLYAAGHHTISFISSHRALDLFFTSEAWAAGLIVERSGRLEYNADTASGGVSYVTLAQTERLLTARNVIVRNLKRRRFVRWLNRRRNLMMLQHGVFGVGKDNTRDALNGAESTIRRIKGDDSWINEASRFCRLPPCDSDMLMRSSRSLGSFISPVTI